MSNFRYLVTSCACKHLVNDLDEAIALAERCRGRANIIDKKLHKVVWPESSSSNFDPSFKASTNRRTDKKER